MFWSFLHLIRWGSLLGPPLLPGAERVTAADRRAAGTTPRAHPAVAIGRRALRVAVTTLQRRPGAAAIMVMGLPAVVAGTTTTALLVAAGIIGRRAVLPAATIITERFLTSFY